MDYFLIISGIILLLGGILGCVIPALPGPPLSYAALLLLHFTEKHQFTLKFLLIWAAVTIVITVIDYLIPIWGAKRFGAGKRGIYGSIIGLIAGMFLFPPLGIIIGPFIGAVIGEMTAGKETEPAVKAGIGTFIGFFSGVLLKLIASGWMTWIFFSRLLS